MSVSAVKRRDQRRGFNRDGTPKRGGENILWKRVQHNFDDMVKKFAADPEIISGITRMVLFGHLTKTQGNAGRKYGTIMGAFDRYHLPPGMRRTAASPSYQRGSAGEDDELERLNNEGGLDDYERRARYAKEEYDMVQKVLGRYPSSRNTIDNLCLHDIEPDTADRRATAAILSILHMAIKKHRKARK